jgi:hypothetical protein
MVRPPNIQVNDEQVRHDINSDDIRRIFPDLPVHEDFRIGAKMRIQYLKEKDLDAYNTIRDNFPDFRPPGN